MLWLHEHGVKYRYQNRRRKKKKMTRENVEFSMYIMHSSDFGLNRKYLSIVLNSNIDQNMRKLNTVVL